MKTYIIIYNAETDFIKAKTEYPESLIVGLINEGYSQDDIAIYEANELETEVVFQGIDVVIKP